MTGPTISVVLPVLDELCRVGSALAALRAVGDHELVVADGGSTDGSLERARELADTVVVEPGGLARQLNRGAAATSGDVLFFPHVDTVLPVSWPQRIRQLLGEPRVLGGAFRLGLDSPRFTYRLISALANLRTACGVGPFGDQALFVRREAFEEIGGFREDVLLEDLDLVLRLRRRGRVVVAPETVRSSVRRWEHHGLLGCTLRNWCFLAAYLTRRHGPSRQRAYRRYRTHNH